MVGINEDEIELINGSSEANNILDSNFPHLKVSQPYIAYYVGNK